MIVDYLKVDGTVERVRSGEDAEDFVGPPHLLPEPVATPRTEFDFGRRVLRHYGFDAAGVLVLVSETPMRHRGDAR